jgi:hypothetical protein
MPFALLALEEAQPDIVSTRLQYAAEPQSGSSHPVFDSQIHPKRCIRNQSSGSIWNIRCCPYR